MAIESGQQLLHYRLIEKIGEGGMGVVWKALDTTLDREIALKVLPDDVANDPDRLSRFEREAKALAALDHPREIDTVARKIAATVRALGLSRFDMKYSAGTLPHDRMMHSIELYGTEVIPAVRELLAAEVATTAG